jgi:Family of unknown function (DUF6424)
MSSTTGAIFNEEEMDEMATQEEGKADLIRAAWERILPSQVTAVGRAGYVPVYDEQQDTWRVFRSVDIIFEGAENAIDPVKADALRQHVVSLLGRYQATIPALEKFGVRVRQLLNRAIRTPEDVNAWANSIFNVGPVRRKVPQHVAETLDLVYDDFIIEVKSGQDPVYVVPADPPGQGNGSTINFASPGLRGSFGPRHEYSQRAYKIQIEAKRRAEREALAALPRRHRGRPRQDGLVPGSPEAKEADANKKAQLARERAERQAEREAQKERGQAVAPPPEPQLASITNLPVSEAPRRPRLIRPASRRQQSS